MLVVEPVIMAPLRREWEVVKADVEKQLAKAHAKARTDAKLTKLRKGQSPERSPAGKAAVKLIADFVDRLASVRILDPACGSGNFLYVAIQQLLELEKEVITYALRVSRRARAVPQVRPTQLHGIEINPYAAELAQVVIWIGYLQWMRNNGSIKSPRSDPEPFQTIERRDAILDLPTPSILPASGRTRTLSSGIRRFWVGAYFVKGSGDLNSYSIFAAYDLRGLPIYVVTVLKWGGDQATDTR